MYSAFYNLKESPFNHSVNPRYTWLSEKQLAALADFKQNYIHKKGLYLITGEAGTGKTAFTKRLLAEIESKTIVATVTDPDLDKLDFFNWLSAEFNMDVMFKSKGAFLTRFKRFLLEAYQKKIQVSLIIDDAHRINQKLIEEILTLSNIEKAGTKLISIFLVGQSGFNQILRGKQNSALRQRISAHFHLKPLTEDEMAQLILYRLKVAGAKTEIFNAEAFHEIYRFSAGYPRMAVTICDRAMIAGCVSATHIIDKKLIIECGKDLQIAGIKNKNEGADNIRDISGSRVPAAKTIIDKNKGIKTSLLSELKIKMAPVARPTILPVVLAIVVILAIYFIYHFKSALLSWASINLDQVKSTSLHNEPSATKIAQKNENESEKPVLLFANEDKKSLFTEEKRTELSPDAYLLDEIKYDESVIPEDHQSAPDADKSSDKTAVSDNLSDEDVNKESLQTNSIAETTNSSAFKTSVAEIYPEAVDPNIEELSLELPEIEGERETTTREFKMLSRRLALKAKLTEIEWQETDIQEIRLEPKIGRVASSQPAKDSKARKAVQPPKSVAKKPYLPEKERQEAGIQMVQIRPTTEILNDALPADHAESNQDVNLTQPLVKTLDPTEKNRQDADARIVGLEPNTEKIIGTQSRVDSTAKLDVQTRQSPVQKPQPQAPPVKSDVDPIATTQQAPDTAVAALGPDNKEEDIRDRLNLEERLQSFLEVYCQIYEAKDLDHFINFFAPDAKENDKSFHNLLPKYRQNFEMIEFITYRIELQNYKYNDENGKINIEGRFFLEWLPIGKSWRRNSGKIFMELQESESSFTISRLDYYGDQRKKDR